MPTPPWSVRLRRISRVGPIRRISKVNMIVYQLAQSQAEAIVAGRISPASATRRWSSMTTQMRSGSLRGSIRWVLLVFGWFSLSKTIIPEDGSTFSSPHHDDTLIFSVDWGLRKTEHPLTVLMFAVQCLGRPTQGAAAG